MTVPEAHERAELMIKKDDGERLDWQSDSGMNAVLAAWHHRLTQQQWAAISAQGVVPVPVDTRREPGTGSWGIEGHEPGVVEKPRIAQPEILIPATIINFGDKVTEGQLIDAVAQPWFENLEALEKDPQFLHQLDWRKIVMCGRWSASWRGTKMFRKAS